MSNTLGDLLASANIRQTPPQQQAAPQPDFEVIIEGDDDSEPKIDPKTGVLTIEHDDGSITIDLTPELNRGKLSENFNDNLADSLAIDAGALANSLISEIDSDIASRAQWMDMREQGLELLGLKIEQPRGDVGNSSAPLEGMSTIRAPTLLNACLKFQANARGELLPASGPMKVMNSGAPTGCADEWAEILEDDMNVYLTQRAQNITPTLTGCFSMSALAAVGLKRCIIAPSADVQSLNQLTLLI